MSAAEHSIDAVLRRAPVIPVYTAYGSQHAAEVARALARGGLPVVEVTLRTPAAMDAIRSIAGEVPEVVVGAGTVVAPEQFEAAARAGARFAVSPGTTATLRHAALATGLAWLPGAATASEVMAGLELGYRDFKFFPAEAAGGVPMLRSLAGPFPHVRFCPTGAITEASARDWLALPNVPCVAGSWLTPRHLVEARDWAAIEALARTAAGWTPGRHGLAAVD